MVSEERRRFPRLEDDTLSLKLDGFDSITHTLNISTSGVYCKVDKELPLMSRVKLMLMVPDFSKDKPGAKNIEVSGIVVRQHSVIVDGIIKHYDIAVFFDDLSAKDKEIIATYISNKKGR
ncbi:MAG: PilZ domain-containing protein [Candidatus Omnitrophota bacterium]|nr:PilZ domain-containing protein [Candidatus Omnitrophota bacterium]